VLRVLKGHKVYKGLKVTEERQGLRVLKVR
jgi:hypothetical protein